MSLPGVNSTLTRPIYVDLLPTLTSQIQLLSDLPAEHPNYNFYCQSKVISLERGSVFVMFKNVDWDSAEVETAYQVQQISQLAVFARMVYSSPAEGAEAAPVFGTFNIADSVEPAGTKGLLFCYTSLLIDFMNTPDGDLFKNRHSFITNIVPALITPFVLTPFVPSQPPPPPIPPNNLSSSISRTTLAQEKARVNATALVTACGDNMDRAKYLLNYSETIGDDLPTRARAVITSMELKSLPFIASDALLTAILTGHFSSVKQANKVSLADLIPNIPSCDLSQVLRHLEKFAEVYAIIVGFTPFGSYSCFTTLYNTLTPFLSETKEELKLSFFIERLTYCFDDWSVLLRSQRTNVEGPNFYRMGLHKIFLPDETTIDKLLTIHTNRIMLLGLSSHSLLLSANSKSISSLLHGGSSVPKNNKRTSDTQGNNVSNPLPIPKKSYDEATLYCARHAGFLAKVHDKKNKLFKKCDPAGFCKLRLHVPCTGDAAKAGYSEAVSNYMKSGSVHDAIIAFINAQP